MQGCAQRRECCMHISVSHKAPVCPRTPSRTPCDIKGLLWVVTLSQTHVHLLAVTRHAGGGVCRMCLFWGLFWGLD